jgi:UDP-glucose 6-dehydrogenase
MGNKGYSLQEKRKRVIISVGVSCFRQSDPGVGSVVDGVESLEEVLAEEVVLSRSTVILGAIDNVTNHQINAIGSTINNSILVRGHITSLFIDSFL